VRDKHHVLIVKAEPQIAESWEQALERAGYLVSCVGRASTALQRLESERIDVVVIDATLSDLAGESLARAVRQRWPEKSVLLRADALAAANEPADPRLQLLAAPVTMRNLKKRLTKLLEQHTAVILPEHVHRHGGHLRGTTGLSLTRR
jgi:DNA-binding response OmpR family regulator